MESRGVAGRPKDPKGAQGGSPKEAPKEDPKRIPKGPMGAGDPAHLLILVPGERLGRQHEPVLLGAALHDADVVDGQPAPADHLRPRGRYGAVMGPLWGRLSPQPPTAPTAPPPAQAHGSQHPVEELWIPTPPGRSGGSQGQRGQEGRDPQKPPDHMKPHPQPHTAPPANGTQRQQQPHSSQQLLAVPAAHRISRALSSPYSTL